MKIKLSDDAVFLISAVYSLWFLAAVFWILYLIIGETAQGFLAAAVLLTAAPLLISGIFITGYTFYKVLTRLFHVEVEE